MNGRFKYEKLEKYPHMKPQDVAVWERFIARYPDFFERVDYDVCVGTGAPFETHMCEKENCECAKLYQKKIDVVAYRDYTRYILEIKPVANMRGLGQAIAYGKLYRDSFTTSDNIVLGIIAEKMENDLEEVFDAQGVSVWLA